MPSPFPGMNPYLEQAETWHDFHEKFLPAVAERLVAQVRPHYIVKLDDHVYVHEMPPESPRLVGRANLGVARTTRPTAIRPGAGLLEAPSRVRLTTQDVERVAFLEIRDRHGRELITVIELLSPSNKRPGPDREQYLFKRETLLASRAHYVEIDLLRGGRPMPLLDRPECCYSILVSRAEERSQAGFWPLALPDRLPLIPVPLRAEVGDARIDLQEVLDYVYDASGYEDYLYDGTPEAPLDPDDGA